MNPETTQRTFVKRVTTKLCVTIDEEMTTQQARTHFSPLSDCSQGYAVYAFRRNRTLERVGSSTCVFPHHGYSAASAQGYITISVGLSNQFSTLISGHPSLGELRFAICCPPPATIVPVAKPGKAEREKSGASRKPGTRKTKR